MSVWIILKAYLTYRERSMTTKFALIVPIAAILTLSLVSFSTGYSGVAVHAGDWIEYNVTTTGYPTPIHNITWARLDVKAVEGSAIYTDIQTRLGNGSLWLEPNTNFDVATGVVGEGAVIPTDLTIGDVYFSQFEGNITVTGTQTLQVAGAKRVVLTGEAANTSFMWDKQTGIMVEATTVLEDCTVYSEVAATNLWQPQIVGLDAHLFYAVIAVIVVAFAAVVLVGVFLRFPRKAA
jgi:hypothetical protein